MSSLLTTAQKETLVAFIKTETPTHFRPHPTSVWYEVKGFKPSTSDRILICVNGRDTQEIDIHNLDYYKIAFQDRTPAPLPDLRARIERFRDELYGLNDQFNTSYEKYRDIPDMYHADFGKLAIEIFERPFEEIDSIHEKHAWLLAEGCSESLASLILITTQLFHTVDGVYAFNDNDIDQFNTTWWARLFMHVNCIAQQLDRVIESSMNKGEGE